MLGILSIPKTRVRQSGVNRPLFEDRTIRTGWLLLTMNGKFFLKTDGVIWFVAGLCFIALYRDIPRAESKKSSFFLQLELLMSA